MDGEKGETEGWVLLVFQHVGDTDVVGDDGSDDTDDTTSLVRRHASVEGTSGEDGKGCGEAEEQGDEADTLAQADDATWGCETRECGFTREG